MIAINTCVAYWRWVPEMSRRFHLSHSHPLDRCHAPMAGKPAPSSHEPHANGTRYLSH